MKYRTKLVLYKGAFIVLVVAAGGLMAYELYIPGLLGLGGAYLFDFALRRCLHCGKHFSIVETPKECCPFCGKKLN